MPDVRPARLDDAPAILDLHVAAIRARAPDAYDERQVAAWAREDGGPERSGYRRVAERTIRKALGGARVAFPVVEMRKRLDG